MHDFKNVSNPELISSTKGLVAEERRITARVLAHLEEIERRRIHYEMGFTSLFDFCLKELGHSRDEAYYRIGAMRLAREVPEAVQAIEEGKLSLTNVARAQTHFRKSGAKVEEKRELLKQLEGLSTRECERLLKPGRQTLTFEVDDETLKNLERIRELWGNQDLDNRALLKKMTELVLKRIDPERKSVGAPRVMVRQSDDPPAEMVTPENRHIPEENKRVVWKRDGGRCRHPGCGSRYAIQFDHIVPYSHGGSHHPDNLQLLCRAHHRLKSERS